MLDGVLFFPVTPFAADGTVDAGALAEHLRRGLAAGPAGFSPRAAPVSSTPSRQRNSRRSSAPPSR